MKNMALLIDTNIVLDWMLNREPFVISSKKILAMCISGAFDGFLAGHTILNAFYISRSKMSVSERKEFLLMLCKKFNIVDILKQDIVTTLECDDWDDLEDGLQIQCAYKADVGYIITRDPKGFESSDVQVLSPDEFLEKLENEKR